MDSANFARLTTNQPALAVPRLSAKELSGPDRTLVYGYTLDRDTFHVYLKKGTLHAVTYISASAAAPSRVLFHAQGESLDVSALTPSKRAYPERTDAQFAGLMQDKKSPLTFTSFNHEAFEASKHTAFHGLTLS